ncbi:MAG: hypothetical protein LBI89_01755, partial [Prevotellaceae bacterium]|nr:hypothetical protein [Prevotellaceae bacterium]
MEKSLFLFAMLASITASAKVTVTPVSTDYAGKKVTFRVAWDAAPYNNKVWVWVDLCPVAGVSPGTFAQAVIGAAAATAGSIATVTGNQRGFYVTANPSTVTATLTNATGRFNWCAYGSDYPPNAVETGGVSTLRGTPPFGLTTASGAVEINAKTWSGDAITALTDAIGCPGVFCGKNGEAPGLLNCCVTGTIDCSGTCRTTGTYTQNDGACAGGCNKAYVRQFNQCGELMSATYSTYTNT